MRAINESYARENDRLLKITNFSEYDKKVNNLKNKIDSLSEEANSLKDNLIAEKEKSAELI